MQQIKELWVLVLLGMLVCGVFVYQLDKEVDRRYREIYTHHHHKGE